MPGRKSETLPTPPPKMEQDLENKRRRVTDDGDDGDWNRGLHAWDDEIARGGDSLARSLYPDDSDSEPNLNDKIDVTQRSESIEGGTAEVFLNVPSVTSDYTRREEKEGPFE